MSETLDKRANFLHLKRRVRDRDRERERERRVLCEQIFQQRLLLMSPIYRDPWIMPQRAYRLWIIHRRIATIIHRICSSSIRRRRWRRHLPRRRRTFLIVPRRIRARRHQRQISRFQNSLPFLEDYTGECQFSDNSGIQTGQEQRDGRDNPTV